MRYPYTSLTVSLSLVVKDNNSFLLLDNLFVVDRPFAELKEKDVFVILKPEVVYIFRTFYKGKKIIKILQKNVPSFQHVHTVVALAHSPMNILSLKRGI